MRKPNDKETLLCNFYSRHFMDNPKFFVHILFDFIHNSLVVTFLIQKLWLYLNGFKSSKHHFFIKVIFRSIRIPRGLWTSPSNPYTVCCTKDCKFKRKFSKQILLRLAIKLIAKKRWNNSSSSYEYLELSTKQILVVSSENLLI